MQVLWPGGQVCYDEHDHQHDCDVQDDNPDDDHDNPDDDNASPRCPYFIDPANNDLTGRVIEETQVKELIVQLHNEVRFCILNVKTR